MSLDFELDYTPENCDAAFEVLNKIKDAASEVTVGDTRVLVSKVTVRRVDGEYCDKCGVSK